MVDSTAPRDLVVFLEAAQGRDTRLGYAAALAKGWQAHLIATFVVRELALEPYAGFAVGDALTSMLADYAREVAESLSKARDDFDALVRNRSFTSEWRISDNEDSEALMLHARHASLAILGPPARQRSSTTRLGLSERMIFEAGRPCLLLPEHGKSPNHQAARSEGRVRTRGRATRSTRNGMPIDP